jgi:hypothetical protein
MVEGVSMLTPTGIAFPAPINAYTSEIESKSLVGDLHNGIEIDSDSPRLIGSCLDYPEPQEWILRLLRGEAEGWQKVHHTIRRFR